MTTNTYLVPGGLYCTLLVFFLSSPVLSDDIIRVRRDIKIVRHVVRCPVVARVQVSRSQSW